MVQELSQGHGQEWCCAMVPGNGGWNSVLGSSRVTAASWLANMGP